MSFFQKTWQTNKSTLLVLFIGLVVCFIIISSRPKEVPTPFVPPPPTEVAVVEVSPGSAQITVKSQGSIEAKTQTQLVSQVAGQIVSVSDNFVAGGFFNRGDVLLKIDPRDYEIALAQQKSNLAAAKQRLAEEKGRALQAKREWRDLGNDDANTLFLRKPQLSAAQASVDAAKATVSKAQLDLERTRFSLPFDGRVVTTTADLGQYVSFGSSVGAVYASEVLEVRLPLTANQLRILGLNTPQPALLPVILSTSFGHQLQNWSGKIVRSEAVVEPQTRLFYAVAELDSSTSTQPQVGMFVEASITGLSKQDVVILPRTALVDRDKVMIAVNNSIELVSVDVLQVDEREIRVQGLQMGMQVLVEPLGYLVSGSKVTPQLISESQPQEQ